MILNLKKKTVPNKVDRNLRVYNLEEYNKMVNNDRVKELLKNNILALTDYAILGKYDNIDNIADFQTVRPDTIVAKVQKIYPDSIDIDMPEDNKYFQDIKDGKCEAMLRYIGECDVNEDGYYIVSNMKLICFDLAYINKYEQDKFYEVSTKNKSFKDLFKLMDDRNIPHCGDILQLNNKSLAHYDISIDNPEAKYYNYEAIYEECKNNIWYFFRNVFKIISTNGPKEYSINYGTYHVIKSFESDINMISYIPRGSGSSITLFGLYIYINLFTDYNVTLKYISMDNKKYKYEIISKLINLIPEGLRELANDENKKKGNKNIELWDEFDFIIDKTHKYPSITDDKLIIGCSTVCNDLSDEDYKYITSLTHYIDNIDVNNNELYYFITNHTDIFTDDKYTKMCDILNNESYYIDGELNLSRREFSLSYFV